MNRFFQHLARRRPDVVSTEGCALGGGSVGGGITNARLRMRGTGLAKMSEQCHPEERPDRKESGPGGNPHP